MIIIFVIGIATIISLLLELPLWVFTIIIMTALIEIWRSNKMGEIYKEELETLIDDTADIIHNSLKRTEAWYEYFNFIAKNFTETELKYLHTLTEPELTVLCDILQSITDIKGEDE